MNVGQNQKNFVWKMDQTDAQEGIKDSKYIPHLFTVVISLGVYISWLLGMRMRSHIKNLRSCLPIISKHSKLYKALRASPLELYMPSYV